MNIGATAANNVDVASQTQSKIKALSIMAEKLGCSLTQLAIAWCLRNSTSQSVIASASSMEQLLEILNSLPVSDFKCLPNFCTKIIISQFSF